MMITIHGLSPKTKYQDVKILIKQECNIDDFILDNLVVDTNGTKKVRIGLPDENEGFKLMKCLNGYHMPGNFLLKVVPVGKSTGNPNEPVPGGFESRSGYQNQHRNDYPNQSRSDYMNQPSSNDYSRGSHGPNAPRGSGIPQGPGGSSGPRGSGGFDGPSGPRGSGGPHVSSGPRGPGGPHGSSGPHGSGGPNKPYGPGPQGPMDNARPSPWSSNNNNSNQWGQNPPMAAQVPQNTFYGPGPQSNPQSNFAQGPGHSQHLRAEARPFEQGRQGPPTEQTFGGYPPKNGAPPTRQPDLRHNLRNIETGISGNQAPSSVHSHGGRYPPHQQYQDKPVTIMKHNFQGPTQFNINHPGGNQPYQQQDSSPWQQGHPSHQTQPPKAQFSKSNPPYEKSFEDRKYPQGDLSRDPKNLQSRPDAYKEYEKRRGFSPSPRDAIQRRSSPGRDAIPRRSSPGRDAMPRRSSPGRDAMPRRSSPVRDAMPRRSSPGRDAIPRRSSPGRDAMPRRSSPGRREEPLLRDPPGRMGDMGPRRSSPGRMETQRRVSPPARRDDPHGRRYSPSGKRNSPVERRNVPAHGVGHGNVRHTSPHKRVSPSRRLVSPVRRDERPIPRFSPGRHHSDKPSDRFGQDKDLKKVRPAYEPTSSHAPNQAMYSGGYRPGHDNANYPGPGLRQDQPGPWQRHRNEPIAPMKKQEEERRDARMPMARERAPEVEKHFSPMRKSRSPIRDRFKRNSPSPQSSYSPRRSWALEKRSSPDAPPPPTWPGQSTDRDHARPNRPNFPEKDDKPKRQPVWEGRADEDSRNRRPEERRPFDDPKTRRPDDRRQFDEAKIRVAKNLIERETLHAGMGDRYQPKFSPRDDFEDRRDNYRRRDSPDRKPLRDDFDILRRPRDDDRPAEYNHRRVSPRRERRDDATKAFDKDFEDIYNRALQFKKKTEELRKSASKKRDDFDDDRRHNEKDREDMRQRFEDRARYREDEAMRQREREDRLRDERSRDDRPRHDDERRGDYRPRDNQQNERERDNKLKPSFTTNSAVKEKRDKAVEEIARKIIERNEEFKHVHGEQKVLLMEELKVVVSKIVYDMFGDSDVSFIEVIVKYQARYNLKDEEKILQDVIRLLPKQMRVIKRHAADPSDIPAKVSRFEPIDDVKPGTAPRPKLSDSSFNVNLAPPSVVSVPYTGVAQPQQLIGPPMVPMMVSAPFYQSFDAMPQNFQNPLFAPKPVQPVMEFSNVNFPQPVVDLQPVPPPSFAEEEKVEGHTLYLCKDDFDKITSHEVDLLKDFLINSMFQATAQYQGWSPDFTLKGLQSLFRYELLTKDEWSRDWLMRLDFSEFSFFNVLVYTKEELWYERAAIWLPGHSKVRNIEPLEKLKLQNKKLEGVNMNKWKFVKKIVNDKGTRLYVDMPPSSARALEVHDMKLSYELQQVNIFLKAVAVDKDSFDAGLKEHSITSPAEIAEATLNSPMPSLTQDNSLVKIILRGSKTLDLAQARKIKEVVIYNIFRYHQQDGLSRTDFVKYGFLQPNYFAILPLNQESKRWLTGCSFGKVNKQAVVVIGGEEDSTRFFKMSVTVPLENQLRAAHITERLKNSNQGVKGINFHKWKNAKVKPINWKKLRYDVEIDVESLETLATMRYQLDYGDLEGMHAVYVRSDYSQSGLEEAIKKYKAEMTDSYDVANMDLESEQSGCESDNGVICLD